VNIYDGIDFDLLRHCLGLFSGYFYVLSLLGLGSFPMRDRSEEARAATAKSIQYVGLGAAFLLLSMSAHHFLDPLAIAAQVVFASVVYIAVCARCAARRSEIGVQVAHGVVSALLLVGGLRYEWALGMMSSLMVITRAMFWVWPKLVTAVDA
jgi:hypothetical protein